MKYTIAGSDACQLHAPLVLGEASVNWPHSSPRLPSGSASSFCMATPIQPSLLFRGKLSQQAPCNILSYWEGTAWCVLHNAHTPACPVSPPNQSSANFPSRFLAPKASPPSSATTDLPPKPSNAGLMACTQAHFRSRRPSPGHLGRLLGCSSRRRPRSGRHAPPRRRFV